MDDDTEPVEHTRECDAAHDAAEVPRGEECDGACAFVDYEAMAETARGLIR